MGQWDEYLDEYLVTPGHAFGAAIGNLSDMQFFAASPSAGDAGWGLVFADPQNRPIMQDDGTEKDTMITESDTLKDAIERDMKTQGPSPTGLWIGGLKYKVVQRDEAFEATGSKGEHKFLTISAARPGKKGAHIVCTEKAVIVGLYDDEKNQPSGNCKSACIDFAVWCKEEADL